MYGEEMPEEELLYVSSSPNRFGNRFYELAEDSIGEEEGELVVTAHHGDEMVEHGDEVAEHGDEVD